MIKIDNPIPTLLSVGVSTYGGYSLYDMAMHGETTTLGIVTSVAVSFAVAYTITVDGMGKHGKVNNVKGINKLGLIIAIQYALLVPKIHETIMTFIDPRYKVVIEEYKNMPKYDKTELNILLKKDKTEVVNNINYYKDSKEKYIEYKNNQDKYVKYSYYADLKADRERMKGYKAKSNSEYSKAVKEAQLNLCDLSNGSKSVAECLYNIELGKLKETYQDKKAYADAEYPLYKINGELHSIKYKHKIENASDSKYANELQKKKYEISKIEEKFPLPYWTLFPIMYLIGWLFETRIANMDVFTRYDIAQRKRRGELETVETVQEEVNNAKNIRIMLEHENMMKVFSTSDNFLRWCSMINDNFKFGRDIATLHAVITCTLKTNPDDLTEKKGNYLTAKKIQSFSVFANPRSKNKNSPYNTTPSQMRIRELLKSKKALKKNDTKTAWVLDELALIKVIKSI